VEHGCLEIPAMQGPYVLVIDVSSLNVTHLGISLLQYCLNLHPLSLNYHERIYVVGLDNLTGKPQFFSIFYMTL